MSNDFQRLKREELKQKCLRYLGGKKCFKCNVSYLPIVCYDFHHHKGSKEEEISKMISRKEKFEVIKKELDKCKVVCANCHRQISNNYYNH